MKIHEYQTKELMSRFGIAVPKGIVVNDPAEVRSIARDFTKMPVVLKAQIHAGGRGKGGGIRFVQNQDEIEQVASELIGMTLVTPQTGPAGKKVSKILIEEGIAIGDELYLSIIVDRAGGCFTILASSAGGMDIEETAAINPEKIIKIAIDPISGLDDKHINQAITGLDLKDKLHQGFAGLLKNLYSLFTEYDCLLLEINPLVVTIQGKFVALDAKVEFDDNALFRHHDLLAYRDPEEEDKSEVEAGKYGLNYISMHGNVGNMVNGAGLAMATMDMIKQAGAEPANFLDVGGGADAVMVENGFRIILKDKNVKAVLINIFGGILRCDVLAAGVVEAARKVTVNVPVVVRMEGTNVEEGRHILAESGLNLITAVDLSDAAEKVAELVS